ncbi:MAG: hypothetical protein IPQ26_04450 [Elusimicrobia bacterium]|nr:hypothetical protein [Elusimicrobiota bacterium]
MNKTLKMMGRVGVLVFSAMSLQAGYEDDLGAAFGVNANAGRRAGPAAALALADEAGSFDIVLWQWPETQTLRPVIIERARAARERGMGIMLGLSPTSLAGLRTDLELPAWVASDCGLTTATVSFSNPCVRLHFINDVVDIANAVKPDSFHLATEINTLLLRKLVNPLDLEYVHFGALYQTAHNAIKAVSPETRVFVSFQYELQKVIQNAPPGTPAQNWENILEIFRGTAPISKLDYVKFTTYPSASGFLSGKYKLPAAIPSDYYKEAGQYLNPRGAGGFFGNRLAHPRLGHSPGAASIHSSVARANGPARPAWVAWVLLQDIPPGALGFSLDLTTTGLLDALGRPKSAWDRVSEPVRPLIRKRPRPTAGGRGVWQSL